MSLDPIKLIAEQGWGEAVREMAEQLPDLVLAVRETEKAGRLTLHLDFVPLKGSQGEQVTVSSQVLVKKPRKQGLTTHMYTTADGGLTRRDPRQPELPFREVARNEPETPQEEASNG